MRAGARGLQRRDLALLALLGALLFLPGLGGRDLWNPDEARYAQVSREMWDGGHAFVPRLNGEVYAEKPPLLFWTIILASLPAGEVTPVTARLPLALAAIAALLLVYRLGERLFGRRAGWLSALAFVTSAKILWQGRFGQIDMLLVALVTAAVWFWVRSWTEDRPRLALLFFLFAGLATLAKGPVGLLPPLLSILALLAITRDRKGLRNLRLGRGLLLWAGVVLAWLLPAALEGGRSYFDTMVFRQNLTRYADPWHHHQPWYYYLTVLPGDFFPWSLLLPTALVVGWRRLLGGSAGGPREPAPGGTAGGTARRGFLFTLCWLVVTLLFFSLSPAKRSVYMLTLYPALGLAVGAGLDRLAAAWEAPRDGAAAPNRGWLLAPLGLLAALVLAVAAALPVVGADRPELPILGEGFLWELTGALAALALAALVAFAFALRRRPTAAAAALAAGMAVLAWTASLGLLPAFDAFKSGRPIARELTTRVEPGTPYAIYPHLDNTVLFHVGWPASPLTTVEELEAFVDRPGKAWLLVERDDWRRLGEEGSRTALPPLVEVARDPDLRDGYLLLTEAAGGDAAATAEPAAPGSGPPDGG